MTPPKSQSLCRFCGHALPQDAPRGFCPACLLHLLGDEQSNAKAGAEGLPAPDAPCAAIDSLRRAGDYEIHGEIDSGGMGVVYLARQISLNRAVALKMIRSGNLATATEIQLFKREAGAAAALDHPNIVPIYEIGEFEGRHYFSMKLIEGGNLAERMSELGIPEPNAGEPLSDTALRKRTAKIAALVACVARAVHHAHQRGVLHRDLKPTNILLDENDQPHLTDFGLARLAEGPDLMHSLAVIGTPAYMAPEQALGKTRQLTTAADIYSLGAILYELLGARPPFRGKSAGEILTQLQHNEPERLEKLNRRVNRDLATIAFKCLDKNPEARYSSALALAEDLERQLRGEPILARPVGPGEKVRRWCRRQPALATVIGALIVALAAGLVGIVSQWQRAESHAQRESTQRRRAEAAVFRLSFEKAETFFAQDRAALGLAHLARLLREHPTNKVVATRIRSALDLRPFCLPLTPVRHAKRIMDLQLSPDEEHLLSAGYEGVLRITDLRSGTVILALTNSQPLLRAMFTPDGKRIVTATQAGIVQFWDSTNGQPLDSPVKHTAAIDTVDISSSGDRLATGSRDLTARIWDAATGAAVTPPLKTGGAVKHVRFSPDGKWLVTVSEAKDVRMWNVQVWDSASGQPTGPTITNQPAPPEAQFTPDGEELLTANAFFFDFKTGRLLRTLPHRDERTVLSGKFGPDRQCLLSGSQDGAARIWNWRSLASMSAPMRHDNSVIDASFGQGGTELVTGSRDATARLWDLQGRALSEPMRTREPVWTALLSADGTRVVTGPHAEEAWIWEVRRRSDVPTFRHDKGVLWAAFSRDGTRLVTTSQDRTAKLWDRATGQLLGVLSHGAWINYAQFSSDGQQLITASQEGLARLWNLSSNTLTRTFAHRDHVRMAEFSPDGRRLVTASFDGTARIWDVSTGESIGQALEHSARVHTARFSPDGKRVVAAAQPGIVRVWDAATATPVTPELITPSIALNARFTPDGRRVVSASLDRTARVWDATSGKLLLTVEHSDELAATSPDIAADGRRVLTAAGNTARLWDINTGQPLVEGFAHDGVVRGATFSPDGRFVVTSSADKTARLWDTATGLPVSEPLHHHEPVVNAFFTPDGRQVLSISEDGTAKLWQVFSEADAIPQWLPELAEAIGGLKFNSQGMIETLPTDTFPRLRGRLQALSGESEWLNWTKSFFMEARPEGSHAKSQQ